ncbi:CdaR family protein [bacterium]|nr:CdaR family protein [bacterium]
MRNVSLKLWSLLIAVALAYFVHSQGNSSVMSLIVPVELQNLPPERVVLLPQSPQAQVTLRGPSYVLSEVTRNPLVFRVRIPSDTEDRWETSLSAGSLSLPPSIEIVRVEPAKLEFVFDTLMEKELQVEVPRIGSLQKDYRLEEIRVSPAKVLAKGPRTEVSLLETVNTQQIDLRPLTTSETFALPLRVQGRFVRFAPEEVQVSVKVRAIQRERRFQDLPIVVLGKNLKRQWTPEPASVELKIVGPRPDVQKLEESAIRVSVEIPAQVESAPETKSTSPAILLPVRVRLPEGIELVQVQPSEVRVTGSSENGGSGNGAPK